jgi:hypothetical protein
MGMSCADAMDGLDGCRGSGDTEAGNSRLARPLCVSVVFLITWLNASLNFGC